MRNWWEAPTLINYWPRDIDTIMAIDENGTTDLKGIKQKVFDNLFGLGQLPEEHRWFTITGVVMEKAHFPSFMDNITTLKNAYWKDGKFKYKNGLKKVVLHSREIRKKEGPFNPNLIDYEKFIVDLTSLINNTQYIIYSSSIDKIEHIIKYFNPFHPYELCLTFIVERYCRYLNERNKTGILLIESRGKKEDRQILNHLVGLFQKGNSFYPPTHFSCIKGVYFNPKWKDNGNTYVNLELADLVSHPIHQYVKTNKANRAYQVIQKKIYGYPNIMGYGLKVFPKE